MNRRDKRKTLLFLLSIFTTLISFTVQAGWYDSSWAYRQEVTISSSITDASLSDFPLLIALEDGSNPVFTNAQPDGDDLLFTEVDGVTLLDHEIETYNAASGSEDMEIWLRIPSLSASADTTVYLYYGNPSSGNQENAAGVWDSDYITVLHLNETSGTHYDSTSNNRNGIPRNGVNQNAPGKIDGADDFDGSNDYVDLGQYNYGPVSGFTWFSWARPDNGSEADQNIIGHADTTSCEDMRLNINHDAAGFAFLIDPLDGRPDNDKAYWNPPGGVVSGQWYNVTGVMDYDAGKIRLYVDGIMRDDSTWTGTPVNEAMYGSIGENAAYRPNELRGLFNGRIDEVRISKIPRSSGWIKASYNTSAYPASYLDFGQQEQPTPTPTFSPTEIPTRTPTFTSSPTLSPTLTATVTLSPTDIPTCSPTKSPTDTHTQTPTHSPTVTLSPTYSPTISPTDSPTMTPTTSPTDTPTPTPTFSPTLTLSPTASATISPTDSPTMTPTTSPTDSPTQTPTYSPTSSPTDAPTETPTLSPTMSPTSSPTETPTETPTFSPTVTLSPTLSPTESPTLPPTLSPTDTPTLTPTATLSPTLFPTFTPTDTSTASPTSSPSPTLTPASPTPTVTSTPTAPPIPTMKNAGILFLILVFAGFILMMKKKDER